MDFEQPRRQPSSLRRQPIQLPVGLLHVRLLGEPPCSRCVVRSVPVPASDGWYHSAPLVAGQARKHVLPRPKYANCHVNSPTSVPPDHGLADVHDHLTGGRSRDVHVLDCGRSRITKVRIVSNSIRYDISDIWCGSAGVKMLSLRYSGLPIYGMAAVAALTIGAPAIATAAGVRNPAVLVPVTIIGLVAGVIAAPWAERYRKYRSRQISDDFAFRAGCLTDHRGRPPKARQANPSILGIHPASLHGRSVAQNSPPSSFGASGNVMPAGVKVDERLPAYVPRDIDRELRDRIGRGEFVLLVGPSTAGKTRAAYEAVAAALGDHVLIAPDKNRPAISAAVSQIERYNRWVLWLDDLQEFLGAEGLTKTMLARLLSGPGRHAIVATIRATEHARITDDFAYSEADQAAHELNRDARDVIDQARLIRIERDFTPAELDRARDRRWDPRIADALEYSGRHGITAYLAAGPQLLDLWEDAWDKRGRPRGAALVAASVDCRRAGLTRPVPRDLIVALHPDYLLDRGGASLTPEPLIEAWAWATSPERPTTSFLTPATDTSGNFAEASSYDVFDYLVDMARIKRTGAERVPDRTLRLCIEYADSTEADRVGNTAHRTGRYLIALDAYAHAARKHAEEFGPDHPATLTSRSNLALVLHDLGRFSDAEREHAAVLADRTRVLGADHSSTLTSRSNLALVLHDLGRLSEAESEYRAVLAARSQVLGPEDPPTLTVQHHLARVLHDQGRLAEAESEYRVVLAVREHALGLDHPDTLHSHERLARVLHDLGRLDEAESEHMLELRARTEMLGRTDAEPARRFAEVLQDLGRLDDAEEEQGAALAALALAPHNHPGRSLISRETFLRIMHAMARLPEAEAAHRAETEAFTSVLGPEHPNTLTSYVHHARVLHALGRMAEAEATYRAVLEERIRVLGPDHPSTLVCRNNLALALEDLGRFDEAISEHSARLSSCLNVLGPDHPNTLTSRASLATAWYARGEFDNAAREHSAVLQARLRLFGPDHPASLTSRANLATVLYAKGQLDDAAREHSAVLQARLRLFGPDHPASLTSRANLATVLYAKGQLDDAARELQTVREIEVRLLGPDHPSVQQITDLLATIT